MTVTLQPPPWLPTVVNQLHTPSLFLPQNLDSARLLRPDARSPCSADVVSLDFCLALVILSVLSGVTKSSHISMKMSLGPQQLFEKPGSLQKLSEKDFFRKG